MSDPDKLPPSRTADQYVLRFPPGLRDRLHQSARASGRSLNSELVHRLQESLDGKAVVLPDEIRQRLVDRAAQHGWPLESELLHTLVDALDLEDLTPAPTADELRALAVAIDKSLKGLEVVTAALKDATPGQRMPMIDEDIDVTVRGKPMRLTKKADGAGYEAVPRAVPPKDRTGSTPNPRKAAAKKKPGR